MNRTRSHSTLPLFFSLVCFFIGSTAGFCWGSGLYHAAAVTLAVGIGPIDSSAVCVFGSVKGLDEECPLSCQSLLMTAWGDCYQRNPDYRPRAFGASAQIKSMSVYQMFQFIAEPSIVAPHATCRNWLVENKEEWNREVTN